MTECRYELKHPFQYSYKGGMVDANFITMTAPNYHQVEKITPIKQALAAAIKERFSSVATEEIEHAQEIVEAAKESEPSDTEDDDAGIDASYIMGTLFVWSGNLTKVFKNAEALFATGAALVDGETKVTSALFNKMSMADFEGMVGTYLANFIVPSLTDGA